jgi:hypothetical protein
MITMVFDNGIGVALIKGVLVVIVVDIVDVGCAVGTGVGGIVINFDIVVGVVVVVVGVVTVVAIVVVVVVVVGGTQATL